MSIRTITGTRLPVLIAVVFAILIVSLVAPVASAYEVDCYTYDPATGQYQWVQRRTVDEATWLQYYRAHYGRLPETQPVPSDPGSGQSAPSYPGNGGSSSPSQTTNSVLTADEQAMVSLVNQARAEAGLAPLTVDPLLVKTARMKSQDMIDLGYFGHTSPSYGSPFDLMRSQGVSYRYAGENLAGSSTVQRAHTGLMNSQGHRANILSSNYTRIGVGIVDGGPYGKMFTQHFAG